MNRVIKFRAWDPGPAEMIYNDGRDDYQFMPHYLGYVELMYSDVVMDTCPNGEHVQKCGWGTIEDAVIEQFTGLTDKAGKEIYEGDIVVVPYTDPGGNKVWEPTTKSRVEFRHGAFVIADEFCPDTPSLSEFCVIERTDYVPNFGRVNILSGATELIVVGNIYEGAK